MALYGAGYGLGRVMADVTGGLVEAQQTREARDERRAGQAAEADYRNRAMGLKEREISANEKNAEMARVATGMKIALEGAEKSGDPNLFPQLFKILNPGMEPPAISFQGKDITIDTPEFTIVGDRASYLQTLDLVGGHPDKSPEVMRQWMKAGMGKVVIKDRKPHTATVSPGQSVVDLSSGQSIYSAPRDPGETWGAAKEILPGVMGQVSTKGRINPIPQQKEGSGPKVGDYATFISNTLAKYRIPKVVNFEAMASNDPAVRQAALSDFLSGEQPAYAVINSRAAQGDQEASRDLVDLQQAYAKMKATLGIGQAPAAPPGAAPAGAGNMIPGEGVRAPIVRQTKKAVFDPATGRFVYK